MEITSEYLTFEDNALLGKDKKTKVILVIAKHRRDVLGEIRWYSGWRQYTLQPYPMTIWNNRCLEDVQTCITALMDERKQ